MQIICEVKTRLSSSPPHPHWLCGQPGFLPNRYSELGPKSDAGHPPPTSAEVKNYFMVQYLIKNTTFSLSLPFILRNTDSNKIYKF
jgi:hypothetical protein